MRWLGRFQIDAILPTACYITLHNHVSFLLRQSVQKVFWVLSANFINKMASILDHSFLESFGAVRRSPA
jgi:hypothetical protein